MSADSPAPTPLDDALSQLPRHDDATYDLVNDIESGIAALRDAVAVLTEERDYYRDLYRQVVHPESGLDATLAAHLARAQAAEARVAVLETGLREWERIAATVVDGGSVDEDDLERHLTDTRSLLCAPNDRSAEACLTELVATIEIAIEAGSLIASSERAAAALAAARALLAGVPAAAPEPPQLTVRYVSTESVESVVNSEPEHCLTCGSTDRVVLGPLCAIFGRFGAEPDAWHGGETPSNPRRFRISTARTIPIRGGGLAMRPDLDAIRADAFSIKAIRVPTSADAHVLAGHVPVLLDYIRELEDAATALLDGIAEKYGNSAGHDRLYGDVLCELFGERYALRQLIAGQGVRGGC